MHLPGRDLRLRMVADRESSREVNPQIASVIRRLKGQVTRREVALFFGLQPKLVSMIWDNERHQPLTELRWTGTEYIRVPVSSFQFPYFIFFDEDIKTHLNDTCEIGIAGWKAHPRPSRD
jgi:hypothetical protein